MKKITTFLMIGLLSVCHQAFSAAFTAVTSGNWTSAATWGGTAPGSNVTADQISIPAGITVDLDTDVTLDGLLASLDVDGTLQSSANERVIILNGDLGGSGSIDLDYLEFGTFGSFSFTGMAELNKMVNTNLSLAISSMTNIADTLFLEDGNILLGTGSNLGMNSSSVVVVNQGSVTINGGLFSASNPYELWYVGSSKPSGVEANGSGLTDLYISLSDNTQSVSFNGQVMINGDLNVQSGMMDMNGADVTVMGDYMTYTNSEIIGDPNSDLTFMTDGALSSEILFEASNNTMNSLMLNGNSSLEVMLNSDLTINSDLMVENGTLIVDNSSEIIMGNNSTIVLSNGDIDFQVGSTFDGSQTYNLEYHGSSMQSGLEVSGQGLNNVTIELDDMQKEINFMYDVNVNGTLYLNTGTMNMNGNDLSLYGNFQSNGNAYLMGGSSSDFMIYSNLTDTIYFGDNSSFNSITIDAGASGSAMFGSDVMTNDLYLTNGMIILVDGDLEIAASGAVHGGDNNNYVSTEGSGRLLLSLSVTNPYTLYPVGNADGYSPAMIQIDNGTAGTFGVNVREGVYMYGDVGQDLSLTEQVVDRTWYITEGTGSSSDINMMLYWSAAMEMNGFDNTNAYITHYTSGSWDADVVDMASYDSNLGLYSMERVGVSSLSPFTVKDASSSLSVEEPAEAIFSVYPNPTKDIININLEGNDEARILMFDHLGKAVLNLTKQSTSGSILTIDLSNLPSGVYFVQMTNGGETSTQKVIKS